MKKIGLSMIFGLGVLFTTAPVFAEQSLFTTEMAKIQISDLSFKEVMRKFYSGQMYSTSIADTELSLMPHIALGKPNNNPKTTVNVVQRTLSKSEENTNTTVALMHPVMIYQNTAAETRYFVMIEKIQVDEEGDVLVCHGCAGDADLYVFKKLANNQFQLVSRSQPDLNVSGSWGRVGLDLEMISSNIQPLGKNLTGSTFQNGFSNSGTTEMWWEVLHLSENDYIQVFKVADAGADNSGSYEEDSPLYYSYDGILNVVANGEAFYPIQVTYKGEKPSSDFQRISQVNYTKTFKYDMNLNAYK